jgi:NAD(P) transhydrogenase subunit alpha
MRFGVAKETAAGETRVALVPETVKALLKKGHTVAVEKGAGLQSYVTDREFQDAGAEIVSDAAALFSGVDCILKVSPPSERELGAIPEGKSLIGLLWALRDPSVAERFRSRKVRAFALDMIPRITRAQSMDVLSSQATIAGYKAVLVAADQLPKFFPMLTTAAGTIRPAQGLILGAGVAGLQAIATARRLGAVVEAYDTRPAVKEQILSLGATFVELAESSTQAQDKGGYATEQTADQIARQQKLVHERVKLADFVITTAQIPGKPAPRLITSAMVADMKPGSVIIDLAAETGGNCELSKPGQTVRATGQFGGAVTICAPLNLPAAMPLDASRMYARNMLTFINEVVNDKGFTMDFGNEVFKATCISTGGTA